MRSFIVILLILFFYQVSAQDMPSDFLTKAFYKERRQKLREILPVNSVAVFFASPVRNRSGDNDYMYHQDPDFYYLTGYKETSSLLMVFKDKQVSANGISYDEIIFVRPRNAKEEMWRGSRLGDKGVKDQLGFD